MKTIKITCTAFAMLILALLCAKLVKTLTINNNFSTYDCYVEKNITTQEYRKQLKNAELGKQSNYKHNKCLEVLTVQG